MATMGIEVRRDGSFVRIDLPGPGKWVLAMTPSTARQLAHTIEHAFAGTHDVDGIRVKVSRFPTYTRLRFDEWPGRCDMTQENLLLLVRHITSESESAGNAPPCVLVH